LLQRVVAGAAFLSHAVQRLGTSLPAGSAMIEVFAIAVGLSLFVGFWTPVAGLLAMLLAVWQAFTHSGDPWANILLATIGLALALTGPGGFSIDARLFGWKRIDIRDRKT